MTAASTFAVSSDHWPLPLKRSVMCMSSRKSRSSLRAPATFQRIVERALAEDADSVSLEPVPEGLEVCWIVDNTGLGTVVSTHEGNRLTRFIVRAAGLEQSDRGTLAMKVAGESRKISVESY